MRSIPFDTSRTVALVGFDPGGSEEAISALRAASVTSIHILADTVDALAPCRDGKVDVVLAAWDGEPGPMAEFLKALSDDGLLERRLHLLVITRRISIVGQARRLGATMVIRTPFARSIFAEILPRLRYSAAA